MPDEAKVVLIAGPTASGKSAAALALAEEMGGEIVNADAIQVYRDLEILSARPGPDDLARAAHHLFGFLDGAARCSAGRWAGAAAAAIADIAPRGPAIIVGGAGLYFKALTEGLSPIPEAPEAIRAAARARLAEIGPDAFRAEIVARDPAMARLRTSDAQRLIRAWEVAEATGRPFSSFQAAPRAPLFSAPARRFVIEPPREALYAAAEARFDDMMRRGALDEARRLLARGLDPGLPVMKALGAAELMAHLRGEISLDAAILLAKQNTRRFIKRQTTWFRHQAADWPRVENWREAALLHRADRHDS
ncbi:MAG: tRNA (adenosine(37)-N6)-dimethylallyltransferase MiaA [Amphiplicatus sp.]